MCGSVQRLNPIRGRHTSLKKKGADNIVDALSCALGPAILGRCIRVGHAKMNPVREEEGACAGVIELAAVVTLNSLHSGTKLSTHKREKVSQSHKSVRFET